MAPLRPFVSSVWASGVAPALAGVGPLREHMLPTGAMHMVFRLGGGTLHLSAATDVQADRRTTRQGERMGLALIGGARSRFYVRELSEPSCSVGAVLRPGAAQWLLGVPADVLAERHTDLSDLWGPAADDLYNMLCAASTAAQRLTVLERALSARLSQVHSLHPGVAAVLQGLRSHHAVEAAVRFSGLSHRQFIAQFRRAVGLAPKAYLRVLRFQEALQAMRPLGAEGLPGLADVAAAGGYTDQAHFSREFLNFSGVSPRAYLRMAPADANHLPMP